jgi:hypothetical protein
VEAADSREYLLCHSRWGPIERGRKYAETTTAVSFRGAELSVTLDVPLAAHRFIASFASLGIKQNPFSPSGRLGADSSVVVAGGIFQVGRPANVGSAIFLCRLPST